MGATGAGRDGVVKTMVRAFAAAFAVFASTGGGAIAQIPTEIPYFQGTLAEAMEKADREKRLLIVYMRGPDRSGEDAFDRVESRTLLNRSVQQWIQWHAVLVRVSYEETPELFWQIEPRVGTPRVDVGPQFNMRRDPYFVIFKDGAMKDVVPSPFLTAGKVGFNNEDIASSDPLNLRYHWVRGLQGLEPPAKPLSDENYVRPLELLFQMDFCLEGLKAKEPVWGEWHDKLNPPPPAPARVDMSLVADENAPRWPDGPDGTPTAPTVWAALELARANARDGDMHAATGIYTWLWEHAADGRPWLEPLKRTIIASEMRELARRRDGSRARFTAMRDHAGERYAWADFVERWDWVILGEVIDDPFGALFELDYSMNDEDEGTLLTTTESLGLRLLSQRSPWIEVWKVEAKDVKRLDAIRALEKQKPAARATDEEWAALVAFRRAVLLSESCRIHAAFLKQGRDADAMKVADALLATDTDGMSRLALAAVAWGASVADERHAAWVKDARGLGADDGGFGTLVEGTGGGGPTGEEP